MWPMLLDLSRDESKRILRRLELEAYSSLISAFRAQGDLNKDKKKYLQDIQQMLSISTERHRAEVRRAVNDEELNTIADNMGGSDTMSEWLIEGRRLIPLMPRLVPQTAFTATANQAATIQAEKNAAMLHPSLTGNKDLNFTTPAIPVPAQIPKAGRPSSPGSNVVVLPSGMSIHIKGGMNMDEEDEGPGRRRKRSQSVEGMVSSSVSTQTPRASVPTSNTIQGISPMKITISKSPQTRGTMSGTSMPQKVILMSSSSQSNPTILQKSVPVVKTSVPSGGMCVAGTQTKSPIVIPGTNAIAISNGNLGNIVTVATTASASHSANTTPTTIIGTSTTAFLTPTFSMSKPRPKTVPRQRLPQPQLQKPGVVIPMGPTPAQPSPQLSHNVVMKSFPKPNIHIKQEGAMKIITQSISGGSSKIFPRPSSLTTSSGTPVVVVSGASASSTATSVTMVTRPITSISASPTGSKILNITTQGGKVIATTAKTPNVVTVNPKTLHLTAVRTTTGVPGSKPNVIVVQKAQSKKSVLAGGSALFSKHQIGTTTVSAAFEKELVNFIQKQDMQRQVITATTTKSADKKVIVTSATLPDSLKQQKPMIIQRSQSEPESSKTSSLLAELIQAAGIIPDSVPDSAGTETTMEEPDIQTAATSTHGEGGSIAPIVKASSQGLPANEWFEYDVNDDQGQSFTQDSTDAEAIRALLEMQASTTPKVKETQDRSSTVDLTQLSDQLGPQHQFYTIEQAMSFLNPVQADSQPTAENLPFVQEIPTETEAVKNTVNVLREKDSKPLSTGKPLDEHMLHELDPQTGLFYTSPTTGVRMKILTSADKALTGKRVTASNAKGVDLLSSSLAQAEIDLCTYDYTDDSQPVREKSLNLPEVSRITGESTMAMLNVNEENTNIIAEQALPDTPVQSTVTASPEEAVTETVASTFKETLATEPTSVPQLVSSLIPSDAVNSSNNAQIVQVVTEGLPTDTGNVTVAMEMSGLDTSYMKMEDFASQQEERGSFSQDSSGLDEQKAEGSPYAATGNTSDSQGESQSSDPNNIRLSKRKRKPPLASDDNQSSMAVAIWMKGAMGVLNRVSKFRGVNRDKGDLGAASWFLKPVNTVEVSDYLNFVSTPMDFTTIKKKLETSQYLTLDDFHTDMLMVQSNCHLYNPDGNKVRQDCDQVFTFYLQDYEKFLEKLPKMQLASPIIKKVKMDKSPGKS